MDIAVLLHGTLQLQHPLSPIYTPAFFPLRLRLRPFFPLRLPLSFKKKTLEPQRLSCVFRQTPNGSSAAENRKVHLVELFGSPPRKTRPIVQSQNVIDVRWFKVQSGMSQRFARVKSPCINQHHGRKWKKSSLRSNGIDTCMIINTKTTKIR